MIPKTSSISIQPTAEVPSKCLLEHPCPCHRALETSGKFSEKGDESGRLQYISVPDC